MKFFGTVSVATALVFNIANAIELNGYDPSDPPGVHATHDCGHHEAAGGCNFSIRIKGNVFQPEVDDFRREMDGLRELRNRVGSVTLNVHLDSGGGPLLYSIEVGKMVRAFDGHAVVGESEWCVSACVLILLASPHRSVLGNALVGIHMPFVNDSTLDPERAAQLHALLLSILKQYVVDWGGRPLLVDDMWTIPSRCTLLLTGADLTAYGLSLDGPYAGKHFLFCPPPPHSD